MFQSHFIVLCRLFMDLDVFVVVYSEFKWYLSLTLTYSNPCVLRSVRTQQSFCCYFSVCGVFPSYHVSARQPLNVRQWKWFFVWLGIRAYDTAQLVTQIHSLSGVPVILPHVAIWPRHIAKTAGLEGTRRRADPTFMPKQPMLWMLRPVLALFRSAWHMLNWLRVSKL